MKRPYEPIDLRKTNDRAASKRRRRAHYKARTQHIRDQRRQLALLLTGINRGWIG